MMVTNNNCGILGAVTLKTTTLHTQNQQQQIHVTQNKLLAVHMKKTTKNEFLPGVSCLDTDPVIKREQARR